MPATPRTIDLKDSQIDYLNGIVTQYDLPDLSKAVRILVEFAIHHPDDADRIFAEIRCRDCS